MIVIIVCTVALALRNSCASKAAMNGVTTLLSLCTTCFMLLGARQKVVCSVPVAAKTEGKHLFPQVLGSDDIVTLGERYIRRAEAEPIQSDLKA
jgi:hypothetical protein